MNRKLVAALSALGVVLVAGLALWWFVLRSDVPEAVSLEGAVESLQTTTTGAPATTAAPGTTAAPTTTAPETTAAPALAGLDGTWSVLAEDDLSFAGFRVNEELANVGFFEAVGRTPDVTGTLEIAGTTISGVEVVVDMTTLTTDDSRRDRAISRQAIETAAFPTSSFVLTAPIELASIPAPGEAISVTAEGDLTIHGVTRAVALPLEAQLVDDRIVVVGSTVVQFADYDIDPPSAAIVLSVEEQAVMEFQLVFAR